MKKRIFSLVLAAACGFGSAADAIQISDFMQTRNENVISFSGKSDSKEKTVMIKVYNSSYDETDKNGFVKLSAIETDENGDFFFSFIIPEKINGDIKSSGKYAVVLADGTNNKKIDFEYLNIEDAADAYKNLREFSETELYTKLNTEFGNDAEKVGCDIAVYKKLSEKGQKSALNLFETQADKSSNDKMVADFNKCVYCLYLSEGNAETAQSMLWRINPEYNEKKFNDYTEADKKYISAYIKKQNVNTLAEVNTGLGEASFLLELKNAKKDELTDMFDKNANLVGLNDIASYSSYKNSNEEFKLKVNEKFLVLAATGIDDTAKIPELFASAYSAVVNPGTSTGDSGNGGTGGKSAQSLPVSGVNAGLVEETRDEIKDISEAEWAREAIEYCVNKNIVSGYGDGSFRPNRTITREEFVTLLLKAAKLYKSGLKADFKDVETGAWYEESVACAADMGLVKGIEQDIFGVGTELTREDMSVIIIRTLEYIGKDLSPVREYEAFVDNDEISDYAKASVEKLFCAGLINGMGDGSFSPKGKLTRAQAVKVLYDACCR